MKQDRFLASSSSWTFDRPDASALQSSQLSERSTSTSCSSKLFTVKVLTSTVVDQFVCLFLENTSGQTDQIFCQRRFDISQNLCRYPAQVGRGLDSVHPPSKNLKTLTIMSACSWNKTTSSGVLNQWGI